MNEDPFCSVSKTKRGQEKVLVKDWPSITILLLVSLTIFSSKTLARPELFVITSISYQTVEANSLFQYQAAYTVKDEACWMGGIAFDLTSAPAGMTITNGGKIQWMPGPLEIDLSHQVMVHATAPTSPGYPCYGNPGQDFKSFTLAVTAPPPSDPPTAAINIELTESAMNNALASLTEVRGINFGEYLAGFVDAWWFNVDTASIDVLEPVGAKNRVRITTTTTANAVLDLFVYTLPLSGHANGWIEGDVYLSGSATEGYKIMVHPTNINVNAWINGVPQLITDIILNKFTDDVDEIPDLELNIGTQLAPLFTCITPNLISNAKRTALVVEWDISALEAGFSCSEPTQLRPTITAPDILIAQWKEGVSFTVTAADPNDDQVQILVGGLPSSATFTPTTGTGSVTGTFSWSPSFSDLGIHQVTFTAEDEHGARSNSTTTFISLCDDEIECLQ